jgi:hypothetical protein
MSYSILAVDLDSAEISLKALKKIEELKAAGATVVFGERKPVKAYGMSNSTAEDDLTVQRLGEKLWAGSPSLDTALKRSGLIPDFEGAFEYTHRRDGSMDIYFIAGSGRGECTFRVKGMQPELWNPVTGEISEVNGWNSTEDGRTRLTLELPLHGSAFIIFRKPGTPRPAESPAEIKKELALDGAWRVTFMAERGAPAEAVFDPLIQWNEHDDFGIRHFSGTATYHRSFEVSAEDAKKDAWLELGTVAALAEVKLNGINLGILWTAPWRVKLTGALKAGENKLEIEVTNAWANRLVGDCHLPPEERITRSNMQYEKGRRTLKNYQGFASSDALQPCGLKGPVKITLFQ